MQTMKIDEQIETTAHIRNSFFLLLKDIEIAHEIELRHPNKRKIEYSNFIEPSVRFK